MSYILDALKRADAERERGHVPGLHSQSPSALTPPPTGAPHKGSGVALMAGASALLLAATVWWWLSAPGAEQPPPTAVQAPAAAPTPEQTAAPPVAVTATPPERPAPTAPALPILAPGPVPAVAHAPADSAPVVAPQPGASAATTPTPTVGNIGNGNGSVPSFAELPPDIRAQLPQVSVSGSTYSSNPAHRMLIANGKVVHEGAEIAPGLQLETIGPGKAVLNHRGTRYSIGY